MSGQATESLIQLLNGCESHPPLGAWYAIPLTRPMASKLRALAQRSLQHAYLHGVDCFSARVLEWIAGFWSRGSAGSEYRTLFATASDEHQRALTELVFGQLLISRKLHGAFEQLDAGFARAAHLFDAPDYFQVMRRHQRLHNLVLRAHPSPAQGLRALLEEAGVIERLRTAQSDTNLRSHRPNDTLG